MTKMMISLWTVMLLTVACENDPPNRRRNDQNKEENGKTQLNKPTPTGSENNSGTVPPPSSSGGGAEENNESVARNPAPVTNVTCDEQWKNYVQQNSVGNYLLYAINTTSTFGTNETESESELTTTVTESNSARVVISTSTTMNGNTYESQNSIQREVFISGCNARVEPLPTESGTETIQVPAGTFDTKWVSAKTESNGAVTISKTWTAELSGEKTLVVKVVSTTTFAQGTSKYVQELVETNIQ